MYERWWPWFLNLVDHNVWIWSTFEDQIQRFVGL